MTPKQVKALNAIIARQRRDGVSPTVRELARSLGLVSTGGVHRTLVTLEDLGFIRRSPARHRAIEVLKLPPSDPAMACLRAKLGVAREKGAYEAAIYLESALDELGGLLA